MLRGRGSEGSRRTPAAAKTPSGQEGHAHAERRTERTGLGSTVFERIQEKTGEAPVSLQLPNRTRRLLASSLTGDHWRAAAARSGRSGWGPRDAGGHAASAALAAQGRRDMEREAAVPCGDPRERCCGHSHSRVGLIPPSSAKGGSSAQTSTSPPPYHPRGGHSTPVPRRHSSAAWPARRVAPQTLPGRSRGMPARQMPHSDDP